MRPFAHLFRASALLILFHLPAFAQPSLPPRESVLQILVPVKPRETPGAGGSLWQTELWIHNDNDVQADVFRLQRVASPCPPYCGGTMLDRFPDPLPIPPRSTAKVAPSPDLLQGYVGEFFYVDRSLAPRIFFELRTHDEARNALSAGTSIPIVNETEARHRMVFPAVPISVAFRYHLRLYPIRQDETSAFANRIRVKDTDTGALLYETSYWIAGSAEDTATTYSQAPVRHELPIDLGSDPRLANSRAVRIEVESGSAAFWAMVSLTNNTSHEVTVIWPQPADQ